MEKSFGSRLGASREASRNKRFTNGPVPSRICARAVARSWCYGAETTRDGRDPVPPPRSRGPCYAYREVALMRLELSHGQSTIFIASELPDVSDKASKIDPA